MRLCVPLLAICLAGALPAAALAVTPDGKEFETAREWVRSHVAGDPDAFPFSFVYGGRSSRELLPGWRLAARSSTTAEGHARRVLTLSDPQTGLDVRCEMLEYADFPALEWVLHFRNKGRGDTPVLEDVQALDIEVPGFEDDFHLDYNDGSTAQPTDFHPRFRELEQNESVRLAPYGGRSSDGVLPFINLETPHEGGVVIGIGWSGQWAATFARGEDVSVKVKAGMERTHLRLHPGEEIRTPAILLLFWRGDDLLRAHNLLRSLLLHHYTPTWEGKRLEGPVAVSPHGVIAFNDSTEANMVQGIANIAEHELPVDCWWIDAGWSAGGFPGAMGTWDPDPARYPNGLKPVGDAAHRAGLRFLLWFEPERVMPDTWLRRNHPEWLLAPADLPPDVAYQADWRLLNLGNPEALKWAKQNFSRAIEEWGIDIYRHDFNLHPLWYWRANEAPDRQGINEIEHITGLYEYLDTLRAEHPGILIDNCASGGRRLDFEMLRRSLPLLTTDFLWDPNSEQSMIYGLSRWLPLHGLGAVALDAFAFRSGMRSSFALATDVYTAKPEVWDLTKERLNELGAVRHLFEGDFYPLTPYSLADDVWIAWQFHRSDRGEGMVQAFRRGQCIYESARLRLHGLEPEARYLVRDFDKPSAVEITGRELMEQGLLVSLPQQASTALITYRQT
jgi:alpha-galactosidase